MVRQLIPRSCKCPPNSGPNWSASLASRYSDFPVSKKSKKQKKTRGRGWVMFHPIKFCIKERGVCCPSYIYSHLHGDCRCEKPWWACCPLGCSDKTRLRSCTIWLRRVAHPPCRTNSSARRSRPSSPPLASGFAPPAGTCKFLLKAHYCKFR